MRWLVAIVLGVFLAVLLLIGTAWYVVAATDTDVVRPMHQLPGILLTPDGDADPNAKLPRYDTLHEAAVVAATKLYECSHYYECGGVIATDLAGKYVIGPGLSSMAHGDETNVPHGVPTGWKFVAEIHSHPCLKDTHEVDFFSPQDLMGYQQGKFVGYMLDMCTGEVHEFVPGRDSPNDTEMLPGNPGDFATHGKIIGHIPVDGKSVEPNRRP